MKHHHKLRFLFVRGLTAIFHVGGLGVVDEQNNTCWVKILPHVSFYVNPKGTSTDEMKELLRNCNNKF